MITFSQSDDFVAMQTKMLSRYYDFIMEITFSQNIQLNKFASESPEIINQNGLSLFLAVNNDEYV